MSALLEFTTNRDGHTVKVVGPVREITDAGLRFASHIEEQDCGFGTVCRIWTGSPRFRVNDDRITTPRRFICELAGFEIQPWMRLKATCKTPGCVSLGHIGW
jgi:hypothetical protein